MILLTLIHRSAKLINSNKPLSIINYMLTIESTLSFVAGNNGVHYVVQIISKLLDPKTSEHTATFVGRLVSILISKMASQLGENLDLMLRAVLSKMQQAEALTVVQVSDFSTYTTRMSLVVFDCNF